MVDEGFYMSLSLLGENVVNSYRKIDNALLFILGQIILFEIDKNKFFNKIKSRFESDLNKVRNPRQKPPTTIEIQKFSMHVKVINDSMIGKGVKYEMVVSNSLVKLFFGTFED